MLYDSAPSRAAAPAGDRDPGAAHRRNVAERLFEFGGHVLDFARRHAEPLAGRAGGPDAVRFRRSMDTLCLLARRFERLAGMARGIGSLPANHERLEAEVEKVRRKIVELTLAA